MCNGVILKNGIPDKHHMSSLLSEVIGIKGQTRVLTGILCQPCGRYISIYLGLWCHCDFTDLEHPFLEFLLGAGSDVQHRAGPHGGARHQGEDMRPAALPISTHNWKCKKDELKTCYEEDKHRFPFLFELRPDRVTIRNIKIILICLHLWKCYNIL